MQNAFDDDHPSAAAGGTASPEYLSPGSDHALGFSGHRNASRPFSSCADISAGGGFAAGIAMSIGFILQYMSGGTRWSRNGSASIPLRDEHRLLVATATGVGSPFFGLSLPSPPTRNMAACRLGKFPLASAILFDLGVFSLVLGATVLILIALAPTQSVPCTACAWRRAARSDKERLR